MGKGEEGGGRREGPVTGTRTPLVEQPTPGGEGRGNKTRGKSTTLGNNQSPEGTTNTLRNNQPPWGQTPRKNHQPPWETTKNTGGTTNHPGEQPTTLEDNQPPWETTNHLGGGGEKEGRGGRWASSCYRWVNHAIFINLNLLVCRHFCMSSEWRFRTWAGSARRMNSFSVKHRSHFRMPHV